MQKLTRVLPSVVLIGAAALLFPAFAPNGYNAILFGGRMAGAVLCLVLAVVAFRTPKWFNVHIVAGLVGLGMAGYVAHAGYNLIPPSENHMRALIDEWLAAQGAEASAEYTDLGVSDMTCVDWFHSWKCDFGLSYKVVSTNKAHDNEPMNIRYRKDTGERFESSAARGCETDFQWTRRLRASSYHTPGMEPVSWRNCEGSRDKPVYQRTLAVDGGNGLTFILPKDDKTARLALEPLALSAAESMVKDHFKAGMGSTVTCDYAASNPHEVRCSISGTKTIWEGEVGSTLNLTGANTTQVRGAFTDTVKITPSGKAWKIVQ